MDDKTKKEIQSATLERLVKHLDERKDVQNIDLMNLAGFCRNCLSRWYREEKEKKGKKRRNTGGGRNSIGVCPGAHKNHVEARTE